MRFLRVLEVQSQGWQSHFQNMPQCYAFHIENRNFAGGKFFGIWIWRHESYISHHKKRFNHIIENPLFCAIINQSKYATLVVFGSCFKHWNHFTEMTETRFCLHLDLIEIYYFYQSWKTFWISGDRKSLFLKMCSFFALKLKLNLIKFLALSSLKP